MAHCKRVICFGLLKVVFSAWLVSTCSADCRPCWGQTEVSYTSAKSPNRNISFVLVVNRLHLGKTGLSRCWIRWVCSLGSSQTCWRREGVRDDGVVSWGRGTVSQRNKASFRDAGPRTPKTLENERKFSELWMVRGAWMVMVLEHETQHTAGLARVVH
jgi:hypothetical protein